MNHLKRALRSASSAIRVFGRFQRGFANANVLIGIGIGILVIASVIAYNYRTEISKNLAALPSCGELGGTVCTAPGEDCPADYDQITDERSDCKSPQRCCKPKEGVPPIKPSCGEAGGNECKPAGVACGEDQTKVLNAGEARECAGVCCKDNVVTNKDKDGDGHDAVAFGGDDCNDTNADVFPGNSETGTKCFDSYDNNCNGQIDSADPSCGATPVDACDFDSECDKGVACTTYRCLNPSSSTSTCYSAPIANCQNKDCGVLIQEAGGRQEDGCCAQRAQDCNLSVYTQNLGVSNNCSYGCFLKPAGGGQRGVSITSDKSSVSAGGSVKLTWSVSGSSNQTICTADASPANSNWSSSVSGSGGSKAISNLVQTTAFSIFCTDPLGGPAFSDSISVSVTSSGLSCGQMVQDAGGDGRLIKDGGDAECSPENSCGVGLTPLGPSNDCKTCCIRSAVVTNTPTPSQSTPPGGQFVWEVTRNEFGKASCGDGKLVTGVGKMRFDGKVTSNGTKLKYRHQSATYHSKKAGCAPTTEEPGGGLTFLGDYIYLPGETGAFSYTFDSNADVQCGRYQADAVFIADDGSLVGIFGAVFNHGKDCAGNEVPPATKTPTPPPATRTPTPSPATPTPTPTGIPAASQVSAVCVGWPTPRVEAKYIPPSQSGWTWIYQVATNNSFDKQVCSANVNFSTGPYSTSNCSNSSNVWFQWLLGSDNKAAVTVPNSQLTVGQYYSVRVKGNNTNSTTTTSNMVKVKVDACSCGGPCGTSTPTPTSTRTPTPTPTTTRTPTPTVTITPHITPTPTPVTLSCSPATQTVNKNQNATVAASGGTGTYVWSAPSGSPTSGAGSSFSTSYASVGTKTVTVTSGSQSKTCTVVVVEPPVGLSCSPATQTLYEDQAANFTASGGTFPYTWTSPGGQPVSGGSNPTYSTQYATPGSYTVTVTSNNQSRTCAVVVNPHITPTPTPTPTPSTPQLTIAKTVKNITQNSAEGESVTANPGDTVEFIIKVSSTGNATVRNVQLVDSLPTYLTYVPGSTYQQNAIAPDGVTTSGLPLGDLSPGSQSVVRFRATVASEASFSIGTTTLTNVATASSSNTSPVTDTAFVNVTRTQQGTYALDLKKYGRNLTKGEYTEQTSVSAVPGNIIEFTLRITSLSNVKLDNVVIRDVVPNGVTYLAGSTIVNGSVVPDVITTPQGLSLGSLDPGQQVAVRFSGRLDPATSFPVGTSTLINTAKATATNVPEVIAQLPITLFNGTIQGVGQVSTGPFESVAVAVTVAALITLTYVAYTRTNVFRRKEIKEMIHKDTDFKV